MYRGAVGTVIILVVVVLALLFVGLAVLTALGDHVFRHVLSIHIFHYFRKLF